MNPRFFAVLAGLLLTACPKAPPDHPGTDKPDAKTLWAEVEKLSRQAESLLIRQEELIWKHWTEGTPADLSQTYDGEKQLFSATSIQTIDRLRQSLIATHHCTSAARGDPPLCPADPQAALEVRALTYLQGYFVGEHIAQALADQNDAISNLEASLTFTAAGKDYPYRDLDRLLASEKDAEKRRLLYAGATRAVMRLSALVRLKDERTEALLRDLGTSYEAFGESIRYANIDRLASLAEQILDLTESAYGKAMEQVAQRELRVPLDGLRRQDIPRLFRPQNSQSSFPKEALLSPAESTLTEMGIDLKAKKNITVDLRDLAYKNPRPLTVAMAIPGDIRVSLKPVGGVQDEAALLHQLAVALRLASIKDPPPPESSARGSHPRVLRFAFQRLGSPALAAASATLFGQLVEDPDWLQQYAGVSGDKVQSQLALVRAHHLYELRRRSGRVLYDVAAYRGGEQDLRAAYHRIMSRACGLKMSEDDDARYLVDREELYQSAEDLQAWVISLQLRAALKKRFGSSWWRSRSSGETLKELWSRGSTLYPQELPPIWGEELSADRVWQELAPDGA